MQLIEQFNKSQNITEELLESIHLLRLNLDLVILTEELEKNKIIMPNSKTNFFEKVTLSIKNEYKNTIIDKLQKQYDDTVNKINESKYKEYKYEDVVNLMDKAFVNDENNLTKLLFSITLISQQHKYYYQDQSLTTLSLMLWEDPSLLRELTKSFKNNYLLIGSAGITNNQKTILTTAAISSLIASVVIAPILLTSVAAIALSSVVLPFGISAITACCLLGSGVGIGTTYASMKVFNKEQLKSDFKGLNYEEVTYILTLKTMLLEYSYKTMEEDKFKEYLNDVLLLTSDLKSDSLYYALVEKENVERNSQLTEAFYRFDKNLLKKYK